MTTTDQEQQAVGLLNNIKAGQQSALEDFYRLFESRVYHYALSRLNDSFEAADTLNEVMMEVWKHAGRFEGRSKVSTWLLGITHHKVYDRLRKRKHTNMQEDIDDHANHISDDNDVSMEQALAGVDDARMVKHCMDKLSEAHRLVIHLAFFEDMHYQDIASIAECPEGTVKTRVFHAKQALKDCLAKLMTAMEPIA
jgi:RNA polymerase sigma-70 factor (ECF subfamily)